jgi:hypothetical protein
MNDEMFIKKLNEIVRDNKLDLPVLGAREPSVSEISTWARFFELCVRKGLSLGDPRWQRLNITYQDPFTFLSLEGGPIPPPDTDFRVGLQLLLGGLHPDDEAR